MTHPAYGQNCGGGLCLFTGVDCPACAEKEQPMNVALVEWEEYLFPVECDPDGKTVRDTTIGGHLVGHPEYRPMVTVPRSTYERWSEAERTWEAVQREMYDALLTEEAPPRP